MLKQREARRLEQELNPHYLKPSKLSKKPEEDNVPPISKIDLSVPLQIPGLISSDRYLESSKPRSKAKSKKVKKEKKKQKGDVHKSPSPELEAMHVVNTAIEMPEGATASDNDDQTLSFDDPHRALDIDLDR